MSVNAVEFRGADHRPAQDDAPKQETDRSAEAMQRLRQPFDLDLGAGEPATSR
ncbi:hypothetical protein FHR83_007996 [Actinoplanes campanulatus]|uniref:Uncharacterized protein n=1 Tax=Actinoplanes campanulatus TaxID=113559 RepID=A0A7W5AQW5_9ACTN|nr:hypothetical protein [Actinoplanes campanulatus]MBB3100274.1 hypothetical protein [Actinoplanes campanulatus]